MIAERPTAGIAPPERVLGRVGSDQPPRTLLCVAGLHGNEPAGVLALERLFAGIDFEPLGLLVGLTGNRLALSRGVRFVSEDLNRAWFPGRFERLSAAVEPLAAEEAELLELGTELRRILESTDGPVFCIDLHTASGPGPAFAVVNDTLPNRAFATRLPVPLVLGLEEEIVGTLADHLCERGVTTVGFEAGQHADPAAVDRAEAAVWVAMGAAGLLPASHRHRAAAAYRRLAGETRGLPEVVEVRHRHGVGSAGGFRMTTGYVSFQRIRQGEALGAESRGPVVAPDRGLILMPLYQQQGNDGFFLVRPVRPTWLRVSSFMRRLRLERFMHWLPGVHRHPDLPAAFIVDKHIARWAALQIFHLLGFRRIERDQHHLTVVRRKYDATATRPRPPR